MNRFAQKPWIKYAAVVMVALVTALLLETLGFMMKTQITCDGETHSLLDDTVASMTSTGYVVENDEYKQLYLDPQLIFTDIDQTFDTVWISLARPCFNTLQVQVFYAEDAASFTHTQSTKIQGWAFGSSHMVIQIPEGHYGALRVDMDGTFRLADVVVSNEMITVDRAFSGAFSAVRFVGMFAVIAGAILLVIFWRSIKKTERHLTGYEWIFCAGCFVFYCLWAIAQPYNYAPDEAMRYDVTRFLFENNRLPVGDELLSDWGFSYAHLPAVLCNQLGYVFMKIASIVTTGELKLLIAARMVSVCCATGAVYFIIKITKQLFSSHARWIMITLVAFMPQFAFLSSYVNNDIVAFLGITMIVYAWTLGMKYNWNFRNASLLVVGMSICALSYYNSYAWILFSIFFFAITYFYQNRKDYKGFTKLTTFIVVFTFLLIGYSFLRHLVIYGDLLGFTTSHYYGELYAIDSLKPSNRFTLAERGVPFMTMLFGEEYTWLNTTWLSFVGVFGYMIYQCSPLIYLAATVFVAVGLLGLIAKAVDRFAIRRQKPTVMEVTLWVCMLLAAVVTVALSMYNSYNTDFQPQGRYCYPAFPTLAFAVAKGYEGLLSFVKKNEHKVALAAVACTLFVALSLYVFKTVYLPS